MKVILKSPEAIIIVYEMQNCVDYILQAEGRSALQYNEDKVFMQGVPKKSQTQEISINFEQMVAQRGVQHVQTHVNTWRTHDT